MNSTLSSQRPAIRMARIALFAALSGIFSQIQIPLPGLIPLSLASFAVYLAVEVLSWQEATASLLVYILLGAVGVPVFSGFGTLSRLAGPTGGYIVGYALCALISGLILAATGKRFFTSVFAYVVGTVALYAVGTIWYMMATQSTLMPALAACVLPFLPGDGIKIVLAAFAGGRLRAALAKGLH